MTSSTKEKRPHINVVVDFKDKELANDILEKLGMNMSTAINIYLKQIIRHNGIPFDLVNDAPNEETLQAMKDVEEGKNLIGPFKSVKEVMDSLNA